MTRLTVHLGQIETEVLDEIITGTLGYRKDDRRRGDAMSEILLRYHQLLGERKDRKAEADAAQQAFLDQLDVVIRERDAVRKALDAERATRRRDRERHARTRERLRGAPRRDLGDLEGRLDRALHAAGFVMPHAPDR